MTCFPCPNQPRWTEGALVQGDASTQQTATKRCWTALIVATLSATRAFFLGCRGVLRHGVGEAFGDPAARFHATTPGGVTHLEVVLAQRIPQHLPRPARFTIALGAWCRGQEGVQLLLELLALWRRAPWRWGSIEPREALGVVGCEPRAKSMCMALGARCNLWPAPALGLEQPVAAAFGYLSATTAAGRGEWGGLFWGEGDTTQALSLRSRLRWSRRLSAVRRAVLLDDFGDPLNIQ